MCLVNIDAYLLQCPHCGCTDHHNVIYDSPQTKDFLNFICGKCDAMLMAYITHYGSTTTIEVFDPEEDTSHQHDELIRRATRVLTKRIGDACQKGIEDYDRFQGRV